MQIIFKSQKPGLKKAPAYQKFLEAACCCTRLAGLDALRYFKFQLKPI
jgi:hypothetical protein